MSKPYDEKKNPAPKTPPQGGSTSGGPNSGRRK